MQLHLRQPEDFEFDDEDHFFSLDSGPRVHRQEPAAVDEVEDRLVGLPNLRVRDVLGQPRGGHRDYDEMRLPPPESRD